MSPAPASISSTENVSAPTASSPPVGGSATASTPVFAVEGSETTFGPLGGVPVTVAVFSREPFFSSAFCTTYVAVQTTFSPGARLRAPSAHTGVDSAPAPVKAPSAMATSAIVTLPVFVTVNV